MAVTIKYKDLTKRLVREMTIEQLIIVKDQLVADFDAIRTETWQERKIKDELMAQIGLICGIIINEKSKLIEHKCEKCGDTITFSRNTCKDCFGKEVDKHYDGGRDDE